eukprot:43924-Rhodomonas_salina.1
MIELSTWVLDVHVSGSAAFTLGLGMAFLRTPWRGCRDAARLISAWNVTLTLLFCILSGQGSSFFVSADDAADEEIIETAEPEASEKMDGSEAGEGDPHTGISYILFAFFVLLSVYRFFKASEPTELEKRVKAAQAAKAALDARMALEAVTGAPSNEPHAVGPTAHVIHILVDSQSECLRLKEELAKEKEEDVLAKFQELAKQYRYGPILPPRPETHTCSSLQ